MSKLSWAEQCRDPRWQKKRLEIMKSAGFQCESCLVEDKPLNVHHGYYERDLAPWDYPDNTLFCLCEDCHKTAYGTTLLVHRELGKIRPAYYDMVLEYLKYKTQLVGWPEGLESRFVTPPWTPDEVAR